MLSTLKIGLMFRQIGIAILVAMALFVAPFSLPGTVCQMPGQANLKTMTCHGCCAAMKCCQIHAPDKSQPAELPAHADAHSHLTATIATIPIALLSAQLYAPPLIFREPVAFPRPSARETLAILRIRLI